MGDKFEEFIKKTEIVDEWFTRNADIGSIDDTKIINLLLDLGAM